jgi:hypothetical protein
VVQARPPARLPSLCQPLFPPRSGRARWYRPARPPARPPDCLPSASPCFRLGRAGPGGTDPPARLPSLFQLPARPPRAAYGRLREGLTGGQLGVVLNCTHCKEPIPNIRKKYSQKRNCQFPHLCVCVCERFTVYSPYQSAYSATVNMWPILGIYT